jgi:beta-glucosidase
MDTSDLTLEEKASLCLGSDFWHTAAVERLGIPAIMMSDGPHGLRAQLERADHVGVGGSVLATCFPTASALGSSWDPSLAARIGTAIGVEARGYGVAVVLGPGINIKRSPLCGRNFEYLSEDPLISGVIGAAWVEGLQSQGVGASLKHYAVNNQETDRLRVSAEVDERTLREIYLAGFERVVTQAQPWTVMCAYNKVNGTYASEHHWLLTEVLRDEWGFTGLVMSDWGAVHDRVAAVAAGLDLEMPPHLGLSDVALISAVRGGSLDERVLDSSVARVLGLVDRAVSTGAVTATGAPGTVPFDIDAHHALAREAAADSAVLLKNDGGLLPLRPAAGDTIAVIGEFARTSRFQGAGSSQVNPTRVDSALDQLTAMVPPGVTVAFAAGFGVDDTSEDGALATEAVAVARQASAVVAFLGLPAADESEGFDREHIGLPVSQINLLARLFEVSDAVVVVLSNGSAVEVSSWEGGVSAILECWLAGQAAGGAVADLLLGKASPSGKLTETIPQRLQDCPSYLNFPGENGQVRYGEGIFVGYRGYDALDLEVSYPFGHGLSYTTFAYSDLTVSVAGSAAGGDLAVTASCTVTNTGSVPGKEIVQVYVSDVEASVDRPVRELAGFAKVDLAPGGSTSAAVRLTPRAFSFWSTPHHDWLLEAGAFEVAVGASSRDLRLSRTVELDAPDRRLPLTAMSTLEEWMADPWGREALLAVVGTDESGRPAGILGDDAMLRIVGNFPVSSLASFPGMGFDHQTIDKLLAERG